MLFLLDVYKRQAMYSGAIGDIVVNTHGEGIGLLEYHAHFFSQKGGIHSLIINVLSVDGNFTLDLHTVNQIVHAVERL